MPYPYTTGHVLIVTRRHVANLGAVSPAELNAMTVLARECERVYQSDGFKVGFNIGKSAGAGVAGHLHLPCCSALGRRCQLCFGDRADTSGS